MTFRECVLLCHVRPYVFFFLHRKWKFLEFLFCTMQSATVMKSAGQLYRRRIV